MTTTTKTALIEVVLAARAGLDLATRLTGEAINAQQVAHREVSAADVYASTLGVGVFDFVDGEAERAQKRRATAAQQLRSAIAAHEAAQAAYDAAFRTLRAAEAAAEAAGITSDDIWDHEDAMMA